MPKPNPAVRFATTTSPTPRTSLAPPLNVSSKPSRAANSLKSPCKPNAAAYFQIFERPLATKKISLGFDRPRLYDFFSDEDRSLFLTSKRSLAPPLLKQLEDEADGDPYQLDLLIFRQVFGPDRQNRYARLIGGSK